MQGLMDSIPNVMVSEDAQAVGAFPGPGSALPKSRLLRRGRFARSGIERTVISYSTFRDGVSIGDLRCRARLSGFEVH